MRLTWRKELLRNTPGEGSPGGVASETGDTADNGVTAGDEITSVLSSKPGDVKLDATSEQGAAADDSEAKPEGEAETGDTVPESGEYEYKLPEGVEVNDAVATAMNPVFKEAGLTQKQVDMVIGKYAELVQGDQVMRAQRVDSTLGDWLTSAKADPEIGGDKWDASIAQGNKVLQQFGDDEIDAALHQTGAGVHPAVLRLFARIGAAISDDTAAIGARTSKDVAPEDRAYADTTPAAKTR